MNKKANSDLATFIFIVIALLLLAPITLKLVNSVLTPLSSSLNATSPTASANIDYIQNSFVSFWDYLIFIAIIINIAMLFIFSFLADTNPVFLILYIIVGVILIGISPYAIEPAKQIFGMSEFSTEVLQLPLTDFAITYFNIIIFAVFFITGIILYAKFRGRSSDL